MELSAFDASRRFVDTEAGRIAYVERGEGPVALFFHAAGAHRTGRLLVEAAPSADARRPGARR